MKSNKPTFIPKMYCNLFGHDYYVSRQVTYHVKEYVCKHCKKELTTNSNGNLIELTDTFREINNVLERIHTNRKKRLITNQISIKSRIKILA